MTRKYSLGRILIILATILTAGCENNKEGGTFYVSKKLGPADAIVTSPDVRLVMSIPVDRSSGAVVSAQDVGTGAQSSSAGSISQKHVICAEPSPDVAKAVQSSFALDSSIMADIPAKGRGEAAVSIAKARAEALAQLGERLATIQLLRDGLYRACEAYANGAIDETTYAVLVSRYDDTMITMLMGEFAAGAFGRPLVVVGGTANSGGSADIAAKQPKEAGGEDGATTVTATADSRASAKAAATPTITAPTGTIVHDKNPTVAASMATMQRKYLENINADALLVACISAMNRAHQPTEFTRLCGGKEGIVMATVKKNGELLQEKIRRASLKHSVSDVNAIRKELGKLIDGAKANRR